MAQRDRVDNFMTEEAFFSLRDFHSGDAARLVQIVNEAEIRQALVTIDYPFTETDAARFIERSDTERTKRLAVVLKSDEQVAGCVSLLDIDRRHEQAELSFLFQPPPPAKA